MLGWSQVGSVMGAGRLDSEALVGAGRRQRGEQAVGPRQARPATRHQCRVLHAILLGALDIQREAFTPVFAVGRAAGWIAHSFEQQRTGRLLRPDSAYAGPMPAEPEAG
jgi:citrate synthase